MIARFGARLFLAALFLFAGIFHLRDPAVFLPVMPPWIPFHLFCIQMSGVLEVLGGLGLLFPQPRAQVLAGWGLAFLLIAVYPANIYMATNHIQLPHLRIEPWMAWTRVALQPLLILALLWATQAFAKRSLSK